MISPSVIENMSPGQDAPGSSTGKAVRGLQHKVMGVLEWDGVYWAD